MTPFAGAGYSRLVGGGPIPDAAGSHEFKRLEEAVTALVDRYERARAEIATLRTDLASRDALLSAQEEQIRDLNQRRQDAATRLDQLIGELDRLDAELDERSAGAAQ